VDLSTGDDNTYLFNPIVVNVMYLLANSSLVALDTPHWQRDLDSCQPPSLSTRGIAYWKAKTVGSPADLRDQRLPGRDVPHWQIDLQFRKQWTSQPKKLGRDPKTMARIQPNSPGRYSRI
jgi:hypothetical protein